MDKKLLIGGVAALALIGGAYYFGHKTTTTTAASSDVTNLGNTASLLQTNSDATTQLIGGESQSGITYVPGPSFTPDTVAPSLLPILAGSSPGVGGSTATDYPYMTPQEYSAYIAAGY